VTLPITWAGIPSGAVLLTSVLSAGTGVWHHSFWVQESDKMPEQDGMMREAVSGSNGLFA
jgi:hypothetical protein